MSKATSRVQALLVDDDPEIGRLLSTYLKKFEIDCVAVEDGDAMRYRLTYQKFDILLLDIMLPGRDGLSLLAELRKNEHPPVIFLTAKAESVDRILGLEAGADDYVVKPFDTRELVARIHSVLRRSVTPEKAPDDAVKEIRFGYWRLNCITRELHNPDQMVIPLSNTEFRLLKAFLSYPDQILNRDTLLDLAVGRTSNLIDRSVDLMVSRLRQKLNDNPKQPDILKTIRGEGYLFSSRKL